MKDGKKPRTVNRGFQFRFRFGSVFPNSKIFGFGSVRFSTFRFGFPVFRLTEQPLGKTGNEEECTVKDTNDAGTND